MPNANASLALGLLGGILCLFGFSLYWGGLKVLGMFLGGAIGAVAGIIVAYLSGLDGTAAILVVLAAGFVGLLLGWRFLRRLHGLLVLLLGGLLGFFLGQFVLPRLGGLWAEPWIPFMAAVLGAAAGALLYRYVIIVVTCALGSYLILQAFDRPAIMVISFVIGLLVQMGLFYRLRLHKKAEVKWG